MERKDGLFKTTFFYSMAKQTNEKRPDYGAGCTVLVSPIHWM
jgi:hypothetical protein